MTGFRQIANAPETKESSTHDRCVANGCRMRATFNMNGQWLCFMHDLADWRTANDVLRGNERIVLAMDMVLGYGDSDWTLNGWQKLVSFFHETELQPTEAERKNKTWYEYRLRNWLLHLAGACAKPVPREPIAVTRKFAKAAI